MLKFDTLLSAYTQYVNVWWELQANASLRNVVALSIGGGPRDLLVRSELTLWPQQLRSYVTNTGTCTLHLTCAYYKVSVDEE